MVQTYSEERKPRAATTLWLLANGHIAGEIRHLQKFQSVFYSNCSSKCIYYSKYTPHIMSLEFIMLLLVAINGLIKVERVFCPEMKEFICLFDRSFTPHSRILLLYDSDQHYTSTGSARRKSMTIRRLL